MRQTIKNLRIETARGLAALLVVLGHVIGPDFASGMHVADDSKLRFLYRALQMLRLPLFTVLSGYIYALRPVRRESARKFLVNKAKRLLLPLISIGSLFVAVRAHAPRVNMRPQLDEILRVPFYPQAHFWYLHSLFVVFVVVAALESVGALEGFGMFSVVFAASGYLLASPLREVNFFGISGACYLLIFFLWGIGLRRFAALFESKNVLVPFAVGSLGMIVVHQLGLLGLLKVDTENVGFVSVLGGLCTTAWLIYKCPTVSWLARVGHYSFGIYLMHVFGTAGAREALIEIGVTSDVAHIFIGLAAGTLLPIAAERVLDHYGLTRLIFLGRDYRTRPREGRELARITLAGTVATAATAAAAATAVAITDPPDAETALPETTPRSSQV